MDLDSILYTQMIADIGIVKRHSCAYVHDIATAF